MLSDSMFDLNLFYLNLFYHMFTLEMFRSGTAGHESERVRESRATKYDGAERGPGGGDKENVAHNSRRWTQFLPCECYETEWGREAQGQAAGYKLSASRAR